MSSPTDILHERSSTNIDRTNAYSDVHGTFDCTLIKYGDDNQTTLDEIQITIINEQLKYSLLLQKSNNEVIIDLSSDNIELVKSKFYTIFHDLTGNSWKYRDQFIKIPGHYLFSNYLDSSSYCEEKQFRLNRINAIPKFISNERAFFNSQNNSIEKTYSYSGDGLNYYLLLPNKPNENLLSSLLFVRKIVLRIGILYRHASTTQVYLASGFLLTDRLVLTCAYSFDPIQWENKRVSYSEIYACFLDPASEICFSSNDSHNFLIQAKIIRRGLIEDNMSDYDEVKSNTTDLALLELDKPATDVQFNEYFDPKLNSSFESNIIPINSKLFLIGYNGKLTEDNDMKPYRCLKDFQGLTIDTLNYSHNANCKSVSIGHLIEDACQNNPYSLHNCSTLPGSSGSIILDCYGRLAGIHIGTSNSRKQKAKDIFFTKETYNKYVSVNSNQFQTFIGETILPNINDDQAKRKWSFYSK